MEARLLAVHEERIGNRHRLDLAVVRDHGWRGGAVLPGGEIPAKLHRVGQSRGDVVLPSAEDCTKIDAGARVRDTRGGGRRVG